MVPILNLVQSEKSYYFERIQAVKNKKELPLCPESVLQSRAHRKKMTSFCLNCTFSGHSNRDCRYCFTCDTQITANSCHVCGQPAKLLRKQAKLSKLELDFYNERFEAYKKDEELPEKTEEFKEAQRKRQPEFCLNCTFFGHRNKACRYCFTCDFQIHGQNCENCGQQAGIERRQVKMSYIEKDMYTKRLTAFMTKTAYPEFSDEATEQRRLRFRQNVNGEPLRKIPRNDFSNYQVQMLPKPNFNNSVSALIQSVASPNLLRLATADGFDSLVGKKIKATYTADNLNLTNPSGALDAYLLYKNQENNIVYKQVSSMCVMFLSDRLAGCIGDYKHGQPGRALFVALPVELHSVAVEQVLGYCHGQHIEVSKTDANTAFEYLYIVASYLQMGSLTAVLEDLRNNYNIAENLPCLNNVPGMKSYALSLPRPNFLTNLSNSIYDLPTLGQI